MKNKEIYFLYLVKSSSWLKFGITANERGRATNYRSHNPEILGFSKVWIMSQQEAILEESFILKSLASLKKVQRNLDWFKISEKNKCVESIVESLDCCYNRLKPEEERLSYLRGFLLKIHIESFNRISETEILSKLKNAGYDDVKYEYDSLIYKLMIYVFKFRKNCSMFFK